MSECKQCAEKDKRIAELEKIVWLANETYILRTSERDALQLRIDALEWENQLGTMMLKERCRCALEFETRIDATAKWCKERPVQLGTGVCFVNPDDILDILAGDTEVEQPGETPDKFLAEGRRKHLHAIEKGEFK